VTGLTELPPEVIERMVKRPEDLPGHVAENIKMYKSNILPMLEVCFYLTRRAECFNLFICTVGLHG
jgi:hypothetical protein